ncbi:MAG: hypothetical protein M1820_005345 [Bogoriella megaspora]|nr:MAG: hypothetical protein M1820_005345 [Bogoriella megaspora]
MDPTSNAGQNPKPMIQETRSHLLRSNISKTLHKSTLLHPQKTLTARLNAIDNPSSSSSSQPISTTSPTMTTQSLPTDPSLPGEHFEPRQTSTSEDYTPNPSKSLPLSPARQRLVDDIIDLYSCKPTIEKVKRYTPDCVYDDQFVYANDRYKMAGQWFALPKLFSDSSNKGYEIVRSDREVIQFKNEQSWTFKLLPKTAVINALVSLSLDPETVDSEFMRVKFHKDQANEKDYSHEGTGFGFKKWQADNVAKYMNSSEVKAFEADKGAGKEHVKKYGTGKEEGDAPKKDW